MEPFFLGKIMGTNYYLVKKEDTCPTCGHIEEKLHIGKSSYGWVFSLHVIPDKEITSLEDWIKLFNSTEYRIRNEYLQDITKEEMLKIIMNRKRKDNRSLMRVHSGYSHVHSQGIGTWTCMLGTFS